MNNDRLNLGVVVPPGNDPPVPLDDIIPAYQQSCYCCSGGSDGDDFKRGMIQTVNAAPGGVIGDEIGETRRMIGDQALRVDNKGVVTSMIDGVSFQDDPVVVPAEEPSETTEPSASYSLALPGVRDALESRVQDSGRHHKKRRAMAMDLKEKKHGMPVWVWILLTGVVVIVLIKQRQKIMDFISSVRGGSTGGSTGVAAPAASMVAPDVAAGTIPPPSNAGAIQGMANIIGR